MTYPRRCPLCGAAYSPHHVETANHATVVAEPGGTPSPWRPKLPGRLLTLICHGCRGEYVWDYFASRPVQAVDDVPARPPRQPSTRAPRPISLRGTPPPRR